MAQGNYKNIIIKNQIRQFKILYKYFEILDYLGAFSSTFWENLDAFIHSFIQPIVNAYYVPCIVIGTKIKTATTRKKFLPS